MTSDMWHLGVAKHYLKSSAPNLSSYGLGYRLFEKEKRKKGSLNEWIIQLMTMLFVGQPRLHQVCQILHADGEKEGGEGDYSEEMKKAFNNIHRQF